MPRTAGAAHRPQGPMVRSLGFAARPITGQNAQLQTDGLCSFSSHAMADFRITTLVDAIEQLRASRLLVPAVAHLRGHADALLAELRDAIVAEVPAYTESHDPVTLGQLARHGPQHHAEVVRLLDGGAVGDFGFVRAHAHLRAEHRFPLEAILHAYRCGQRSFMRWLRQPTPVADVSAGEARRFVDAVADFALEYTDAVSTVAAAAYAERTRRLAEAAEDQRAELLNILLDGYDESDARVAALLRRAGYLDGRQTFCVVLAQSVDATEMASPSRARRLASAIDQLVPPTLARRLVDLRDGLAIGVFSALRRSSGWTAPAAPLAAQLARELGTAGNAVLIGISGDVNSTSRIPAARRQALLAMRTAGISHRVVEFAAIPLPQLLIHLAGEELQRLLPAWAGSLYEADDRLAGVLVLTLRAYADADMNVLKAAARLAVHPNTVYARLSRVGDITGLDARGYRALTDLITVADARAGAATTTTRR
jgi:PucR C-terminal helix-turn-helix domain